MTSELGNSRKPACWSVIRKFQFNSLWSVWYCLIVFGLDVYILHISTTRYERVSKFDWGAAYKPQQLTSYLALLVISGLIIPLFCFASILKVGNYSNDGIKFGRDPLPTECQTVNPSLRVKVKRAILYMWRHFCPVAQSLHVISAFLLLLPDTLQTAVEIEHGHTKSEFAWKTDLDFLYQEDRSFLSNIKAAGLFNFTNNLKPNVTSVAKHEGGTFTVAYGNFGAALIVFAIRFSAVYWYTNKIMFVVFGFVLVLMAVNSLLAFSTFSILYKVAINFKHYPHLSLTLSSSSAEALFILAGFVSFLSTITIFEYGFYFFKEKANQFDKGKKLTSKPVTECYTCRAYVSHAAAMISMGVLCFLKGPLIYDYIHIYTRTRDRLVLSGVIFDVLFMLIWVTLWFVLIIKQTWSFRILDYTKVDDPIFTVDDGKYKLCRENRSNSHLQYDIPRKINSDYSMQNDNNYSVVIRDHYGENDERNKQIRKSHNETKDIDLLENDPKNPIVINGVLVRETKQRRSNARQRVTFCENVKSDMSSGSHVNDGRGLSRSESANVSLITNAEVYSKRRNSDPSVHAEMEMTNLAYSDSSNYLTKESESVKSQSIPTNYRALDQNEDFANTNPYYTIRNDFQSREPNAKIVLPDRYKENLRTKCDEYYSENSSVCSGEVTSTDPNLKSFSNNDKRMSNSSRMSDLSSNCSSRPSLRSDSRFNADYNYVTFHKKKPPVSPIQSDSARGSPLYGSETSDFSSKRSSNSPLISPDVRPLEIRINNVPSDDFHDSPLTHSNNTRTTTNSDPSLKNNRTLIVRRDSANFSLSSSQETSSNESEHGGLCSEV